MKNIFLIIACALSLNVSAQYPVWTNPVKMNTVFKDNLGGENIGGSVGIYDSLLIAEQGGEFLTVIDSNGIISLYGGDEILDGYILSGADGKLALVPGAGVITPISPLSLTGSNLSILGLSALGDPGQLIKINGAGDGFEYFDSDWLTEEVDGSVTNELQDLSYNAGTHSVDISLGGTSAVIPLAKADGSTLGLATFDNTQFSGTGTISILADGIALGTLTSGNYAAGDAEAGNATGLSCFDCVTLSAETAGNYAAGDSEAGSATGVNCSDCVALGSETSGNYAAGDSEGGDATGVACTDCLALTTETTGNYVASVSTTTPLSGGAAGSEGAAISLAIAQSNTSTDGYLSSANWNTFNNKAYTLTLSGTQGTVADATSYYSGAVTTGTSTTAAINRVPIPATGTLVAVYVYQLTAGTLSTGESSTMAIRYDNTTDVTISASVLNSSASLDYSATGLTQAVTAGHYIEFKFTGATWSTNPSNIRWTVVAYIRPS